MKITLVVILVGILLAPAAVSQETPAPAPVTRTLQITGTVPLNRATSKAMLMPVKCDSKQGIYFREFNHEHVFAQPLLHFTADGAYKSSYTFAGAKTKFAQAFDFFVDEHGAVYQLVVTAGFKPYVLQFDADGTIKRELEIQAPVEAHSIAVLESGDMLIGGLENDQTSASDRQPFFLGLFDSSGKLLKRIAKSGPEIPGEAASTNERQRWTAAIQGGQVVVGGSNAYYLALQSPAQIAVISSAGELVRTFQIDSPEIKGLVPGPFKWADGSLAILFFDKETPRHLLLLVDPQSGDIRGQYTLEPGVSPGGLVCANQTELAFVDFRHGKRVIQHVNLQ